MRWLKKYAAILVLLTTFPLVWFIGRAFVTEYGTEVYEYIPQESDMVIEVNNINFISEFAYQRIFNEAYVLEKIDFEEVEVETGIDYFSKIIIFREQWANENLWVAVIGYENKALFERYAILNMDDPHIAFSDDHAIVQLSKSDNQEQITERLNQIARKDIKPFTSRVDLKEYFKPEYEINCYFIPPTSGVDNQLIDGYLNFDFKKDHVEITGDFTPVSGVQDIPGIEYELNEEVAFSMRSSLNIFNSIYWFSEEKLEGIPEYSQMALDYNGVKFFMFNGTFGYDFPYKTFPELHTRFDLVDHELWHNYFDTLHAQGRFRIDTTVNSLITEQGAFFQYELTEEMFELGRTVSKFETNPSEDVYFDLQLKIADLINNTKFAVDEDNPPSDLMIMAGTVVAEDMLEDLRVLENVEQVRFQLTKKGDDQISADGNVSMKNPNGESIIECMVFAKESIYFITQALEIASDMDGQASEPK